MFYDKILCAALTTLMSVTQSIYLILRLFNYLSNLSEQYNLWDHIYEICSDTTTKVNTNSCFLVADDFHNLTSENRSYSVLAKGLA